MLKRIDTDRFDLLDYFDGQLRASGVFEDRAGRLRRRFDVEITGQGDGSRLILHELFRFDDGECQNRVWCLKREGENGFSGTAEDCVGEATGGFGVGRAWMRSTLRLKVGHRLLAMDFSDVFYDAGKGRVLNRSVVSKWGVRLGLVLIMFEKS